MPQLDRYELIIREFIADVEAVGPKTVGRTWPDLSITYNKAKAALALRDTETAELKNENGD